MTTQRIVVTGATGNIGTSVVDALDADPTVGTIVGLGRRRAGPGATKAEFVQADVARDDLVPILRQADAVVHLAWLFQPTRRPEVTWRANVLGSLRVFDAVAEAGVPKLVYSSSVGAYSPAAHDRPVAEDWPTHGWPGAAYPREKAYVERCLDNFEQRHPDVRVVRVRPGFVFQRAAASEQRRLFGGPFVPGSLMRPSLVPVLPGIPGLRMQVVHSIDLADAIRRCVLRPVSGSFNVATEPVVDMPFLAEQLGARLVPVPAGLVKHALGAAWRLHLVPATPGLFEAVLHLPVMDTGRARSELDWQPRYTAAETVAEFLAGLRAGAGADTAPLAPDGQRAHELATGVGRRP
ncbi:NAD-dependent epimerase/dehydratase family protein [Amycolatopsis carbonis]|uniref:NAD-dependent epimerase/dehydratase family protein n=1 Tax=Amycolatopsis carbonis TaxID=715471 RepID=A0A9Y2IBQ9_9PSEU|nr:NAD-dependent epimerase/dehydratase family protein [Amycolatopsis sp. 2-15]WIX75558.1 NAD-dependent epimerase/dehydratase family protein [Amycolatopsis sp. 2-15]